MKTHNNTALAKPVTEKDVDAFIECITRGTEAWVEAGQKLNDMVSRDKDTFAKIRRANPSITVSQLRTFQLIGLRRVYPPLLADTSPGAKRLLECDYADQEHYFKNPVDVVVNVDEDKKPVVIKKSIASLNQKEIRRVFNGSGLNPIASQAASIVSPQPLARATKTIDIGYYALTITPSGMLTFTKCEKNGRAQPVHVTPTKDGWKSTVIVFYRQASDRIE